MILICVKWKLKPEHADQWPELCRSFTEATRAEAGNVFFEWSRSVDDPTSYTLLEAFEDDAAGDHVNSDHFKQAQVDLPQYVTETPLVRNIQGQPVEWDRLGEFSS